MKPAANESAIIPYAMVSLVGIFYSYRLGTLTTG